MLLITSIRSSSFAGLMYSAFSERTAKAIPSSVVN